MKHKLLSLLLLALGLLADAGFGRGILSGKQGASGAAASPRAGATAAPVAQTRAVAQEPSSVGSGSEERVTADKVASSAADGDDVHEGFAPLQVLCEVNGFLVPAIIDTGAQITVMSASCAKRCRISGSIDARFSGRAAGVGSSDIIGRIDGLGMRVGPVNFEGKVSILREARVDFLIGLDLLQRFKTEVNLRDHVLKLQVRDRVYRVPLLRKNVDLEVPVAGAGAGVSGTGFGATAGGVSGVLEDPDYYESEFPEEDAVGEAPLYQQQTQQSQQQYRSLDSYSRSSSSSSSGGAGGVRTKEPAVSLEGV